nr:unnamed protein product [Callosobruchus analis]
MVRRGGEPHRRGAKGKQSLPEKVATFYYTLGLFCITYPICILVLASLVIVASWLPLVNFPFPGKAPQVWQAGQNSTDTPEPFCYVQQVVMRVAVLPWEPDLTLGDAFRAPLYEAFQLLDIIRNYQDNNTSKTLGHVCLHIEASRSRHDRSNILPQYNCLVLSPANLWRQDVLQFSQDNSILTTIFNHHSIQKGKTSIAEMLFGMHLFDTGIKRYPIRNRQRIIQYAVTLFFKEYDMHFIDGLREKLTSLYPLHQNDTKVINLSTNDTLVIQYPGEISYLELAPIFIAFVLVFMYYFFSIRKIDMIKSKLGMAVTATFTVFCTLTTTMGICFFFGVTFTSEDSKAIFPYLILLVGLENVLVLTKSVVSTPLHLDVKIRNAQGLSKEGWCITKNLLLEITVLTFGLFTFVPAIQEFCIFSIVGLVMDIFLQLFFFLTILGLDISRTDNSIEKTSQNFRTGLYQTQYFFESPTARGIIRSKSQPRLSSFPTNVIASQTQSQQDKKIPKRVRLVNIWARTRLFQRSFMLLMIFWISMILYKSDIINQYLLKNSEEGPSATVENFTTITVMPLMDANKTVSVNYLTYNPVDTQRSAMASPDYHVTLSKLKHPVSATWPKLSVHHWPAILRTYNVSVAGRAVAVLPNIRISHVIQPERAVLLRNPDEKYGDKFRWQALAAALDPIDFSDPEFSSVSGHSSDTSGSPHTDQPYYPQSPMEIMLTSILCLISVAVLSYALVVLYRCVCSRNYAEWRASWRGEKESSGGEEEDRVLLEAVPVVLEGHAREVECIATDGRTVVSCCLGGQLKMWDTSTGELLSQIDRKDRFSSESSQDLSTEYEDTLSDYESGSPPSREPFPKLLNKINTDFSHHTTEKSPENYSDSKYDFNKAYRYFYFNHKYDIRLRHKPRDEQKRHSIAEASGSPKMHLPNENQRNCDDRDLVNRDSNNSNIVTRFDRELSGSGSLDFKNCKLSPIWCLDYFDNLIVVGCADGRLEFWDATTANLKCIFEDGVDSGVTHVKMIGPKVVAARLCGTLEFFQLQTYSQGRVVDWNFTCAYRRMHVRTGSAGSIAESIGMQPAMSSSNVANLSEILRCLKIHTTLAHQQPITCLDCEGGRVLTGGQDHVVKAFRLDDGQPIYALHGHCGPITCAFVDRVCPATAGSGSQDGMLCVWDLMTGACMYSNQAHNGSITSLTYSASYVISLGTDERLCVWERFQGHLLNTISIPQTFSNQILMLAQHLVITARSGGLIIWDVRTGDCVRTITLGRAPFVFINQMILLRDAVMCDYGKQLRIVRFPLITHKFD